MLNVLLPYDTAVPILGISHREVKTYSHTKTCAQMLIAPLFAIAKSRKAPKSSSMGDWMNRLWDIHPGQGTTCCCTQVGWISKTFCRLRDGSLKCDMLYDSICSAFLKRQKCSDREQMTDWQGLWVWPSEGTAWETCGVKELSYVLPGATQNYMYVKIQNCTPKENSRFCCLIRQLFKGTVQGKKRLWDPPMT